MGKKTLFKKVHPATITVWAAIIAVSSLLPAIPIIGTGGTMSISNCLIPLAGIFFGPIGGTLAAAIGCFIGQLLAPATAIFGIWSFLIGTIGALVAGLIADRKRIPAIVIAIIVFILWFVNPLGRAVPEEAIYLGIGLVAAVVACFVGPKLLLAKSAGKKGLGVLLISFAAIVVSALYGNWLALIMYQLPREAWIATLFIAPVERLIFAIASMIIGVPLLIGLPKVGVPVGPQVAEDDTDVPDIDA